MVPPTARPAPGRAGIRGRAEKLEPAQIVPPAPASLATVNARPPEPAAPTQAAPEPAPAPAPAPAQAAIPNAATPVAPAVAGPALASAGLSPEALRRTVSSAVQGADCAVVHGDLSRSGVLEPPGRHRRRRPGADTPPPRAGRRAECAAGLGGAGGQRPVLRGAELGACLCATVRRQLGRDGGRAQGRADEPRRRRQDRYPHRVAVIRAYLQVDYFSSDGSVAHLRSAAQGNPVLPARSSQSFVAGEAAPPFGTDLIVAIASSAPLFAKNQTLADTADAYVRELRSALDTAKSRHAELAAGAVVVRISPKS